MIVLGNFKVFSILAVVGPKTTRWGSAFYKNFSSLARMAWERQCFEDIFTKDQLLTDKYPQLEILWAIWDAKSLFGYFLLVWVKRSVILGNIGNQKCHRVVMLCKKSVIVQFTLFCRKFGWGISDVFVATFILTNPPF